MEKKAIGVFDSGLGGLTAVKQLLKVLPEENIIYFGDTGRVPYGNRSNDTIKKYALQDARFLLKNNVKMVIAACGTVSSVAGDLHDNIGVPYTGVVNPTVYTAVRTTKNNRVGVIGTSATISSHSYKRRLQEENPDIRVFEQDCPLFVPLVENGFIDRTDPLVILTIERYLNKLKENDVDTLILGCTHYPILREAIQYVMGSNVTLIDSGMETAYYTKKVLRREGLLTDDNNSGNCKFFVSDTPDGFERVASIFLGRKIDDSVTQIDIEEY